MPHWRTTSRFPWCASTRTTTSSRAPATHWAQTSPTTWEFYIQPGIMWSDGNELTANDYVETFRYSADPKHAWDFAWYWSGVIKNYTEAVAGKAPVNSIGVGVGSNKYTFVVTTEGPVAFIPNAMLYSMPLSAAGLAKYGNGLYNINPATCISCGPYILKTFNPTSEVVLTPNPKYSAPYRPYITHQKAKIYAGADYLPLLDTGVVDFNAAQALSRTDLAIAKKTPKLSKVTPATNPQDFRVYYVFFKTKAKPFNNLKVRQAFAHSVDRNQIINALLPGLAVPAYGYLMEGYPFAVSQPLEPDTNYDPAKAQKLLAEAGYPKGSGFPTVTFSYPAAVGAMDSTTTGLVAQALSQNWNQVLFGGSSTLLLSELDTSTFYTKMEALPTQVEMGFVVIRHGLLRCLQHAQRLQGRRPPRLGQRPLRQPVDPRCGDVQPGQAPGNLYGGTNPSYLRCARCVCFPRPRRVPRRGRTCKGRHCQELPRLQRPRSGRASSPSPPTKRGFTSATTSSITPARARVSNNQATPGGMKR